MITGKVISVEAEPIGVIKMTAEYVLTDGTKVSKFVRFSTFNFTKENVEKAIKTQCEIFLRQAYCIKQNAELAKMSLSDIAVAVESAEYVIKMEIKDASGNIIQPKESFIIGSTGIAVNP